MKVNWPERVWVNSPVRVLVQKMETRFFRKLRNLPAHAHCLEIGCGRGAALSMIAQTFQTDRIDALDLDLAMLELAMRRKRSSSHTGGLCVAGDAQDLPYPEGSFDAVFSFGILHHLEDWRHGIHEIARVLRKGGGFYFEEIYPPLYANFLFRHILAHPTANRFHGPEFRAALADSGLRLFVGYRENLFGILGVAEKGGVSSRRCCGGEGLFHGISQCRP